MREKILFMKFCCIGDVLFSIPSVKAIKKAFPLAHTTYITGEWTKDILINNPYIDEVIIFDVPVSEKNRFKKIFISLKEAIKLRRKKFDILINFHRSFSTSLFGYLAGIPKRIGFKRKNISLLLTNSIPFNVEKHEVDRYLDIVKTLGVTPDEYRIEIFPTEKDRKSVDDILKNVGLLDKRDPWIAIAPGGGVNPLTTRFFNKRWLKNRFSELGDLLANIYSAKIILIGGSTDIEQCIEVSKIMKFKSIILAGKMKLRELAAFLSKCDLFIGNDSGPLYIAAACTSTVSIFGPSDPRLVAPRGENHLYIWEGVECSPCYHPESLSSEKYLRCDRVDCMNMISVEKVFDACKRILTEKKLAEVIRNPI